MTGKFQEPLKTQFLAEGFLVLRSALDPETELTPLAGAWSDLIDRLASELLGSKLNEICANYRELDFPNRFASLVGVTNGGVFHHIDPALAIFEKGYRRWRNVSSAQIPELFDLMRNPRILDLVESVIGPEISATPLYHFNLKLGTAHLQQLQRVNQRAVGIGFKNRRSSKLSRFLNGFHLGQTPWHVDGFPEFADDFEHNYVNAWVPMTEANSANSSLIVLPRSHLGGYREFPEDRKNEALQLDTRPGDIVLMDAKLFHASTQNKTSDSYRWAFNMRYLPIGHRKIKPFLPSFVARSRENPGSELTDARLWADYWDAALEYLDRYELPLPDPFELSASQVERIEERWRKLIPAQDSWLSLHRHGSSARAIRSRVRCGLEHVQAHIASLFSDS